MHACMGRWLTAAAVGLCACLVLPLDSFGANDQVAVAAPTGHRPRIGLVLAGGGAKGGAHVGVIKVLEQMHVPIDCIAGTSMGALIGAGYAAGLPAADLEKFVVGIDWQAVVGGAGRRDARAHRAEAAGDRREYGLRVGPPQRAGRRARRTGRYERHR